MTASVTEVSVLAQVVNAIARNASARTVKSWSGKRKTRFRRLIACYRELRLNGCDHNQACAQACKRVNTTPVVKADFKAAVTAAARAQAKVAHPAYTA